ncbi:MAG TPA: hypothetical protein VL978_05875 [Puia sp.]|nr:hypothetical protein [Puia sp.]
MRPELNEVRLIDKYLLRQLNEEEARTFESGLLLNDALAEKVEVQRTAHGLIRLYGRRRVRSRLDGIYRQLLTEGNFAHQLETIFT